MLLDLDAVRPDQVDEGSVLWRPNALVEAVGPSARAFQAPKAGEEQNLQEL